MSETRRPNRVWLFSSTLSVAVHVVVFTVLPTVEPSAAVTAGPVAMRIAEPPPPPAPPPIPPPPEPKVVPVEVKSKKARPTLAPKIEIPAEPAEAPPPPLDAPKDAAPEVEPAKSDAAPGAAEEGVGTGPVAGHGPMIGSGGTSATAPRAAGTPDGKGEGAAGAQQAKRDLSGYHKGVYGTITARRHYPPAARRLGLEGRAVLIVTIDRQGKLVGRPKIIQSTGHDILDEEAERMVERASFPPLPASYAGATAEFTIPIRFRLND